MRPGIYSTRSLGRLETCHRDLIVLFHKVVLAWDNTILFGHRKEEEQELAFEEGRSTKHWPDSKHNKFPSLAVDAAPWHSDEIPPLNWGNLERWRAFGGFVMGVVYQMGIKLRWGGDWDGDWNFKDQRLVDMPHFELIV